MLWSRSRAGEKLRLRAVAVWFRGTVVGTGGNAATILLKFSHFLTTYTQIEGKNRYTLKKLNYLLYFFT